MRILLNERALLKISGSDAEIFLQNQLSNDISKLDHSSVQINAYCQHQGKIIVLLWLMRYKDSFLLSFPVDLLEKVFSRLQIFVMTKGRTKGEHKNFVGHVPSRTGP